MNETVIIPVGAPESLDPSVVGGKGASLGRLVNAGFPVPAGFCVSTVAYAQHGSASGLAARIREILKDIDYGDSEGFERHSASIRSLILDAEMPESLAGQIAEAYRSMTDGAYVAVRSSGTAEDLQDASFAGLHDTYLDIRGEERLLDAIQQCWASMWTARAIAYRRDKGFDHATVSLSVVVQEMVAADVSGVMFTANPMNARTDEIAINANWGLGESIVSGLVTPDEIIVSSDRLEILERRLGSKALRIDRSESGGTSTTEVPESDRGRFALSDSQMRELARLGLRIQGHSEGMPQDIEWALVGDRFYVLQSRPVTGVELNWDSDVDAWRRTPEDRDVTWTKAMSEEAWTGAISPLFYSWRAHLWQVAHEEFARMRGLEEAEQMWLWKFHRGAAYYNTRLQKHLVEDSCPPPFREPALAMLAPEDRESAAAAPFSLWSHIKSYVRTALLYPKRGVFRWLREFDGLFEESVARGRAYLDADLSGMTDESLIRHVDEVIDYEGVYYREIWFPFSIYGRDMSGLMAAMLYAWYDGDNDHVLVDLMTGAPKRTVTMEENHRLWKLSERIRHSEDLLHVFNEREGTAFLAALAQSDEGRAFLAEYQDFLGTFGCRGHQDRDMVFPRRSENPSIDYRSLKAMLSVEESQDPEIKEEEVNRRREEVLRDVLQNMRRKSFGRLRGRLFAFVHDYVLRFIMVRDNERMIADVTTMAVKRGYQEINRRMMERGLLADARDFNFLSRAELYSLFRGQSGRTPLVEAKITARKRDFDARLNRTEKLGEYLRRGRELDLDAAPTVEADGSMRGAGTSRGQVRGVARVVHSLEEIGRVKEGEILVCHATDPGWTPVFIVISGLVLETGGVLAHGSCLSREYGLPCVQLANATELIPDGAKITIDGDTGLVGIDGAGDN